MTELETLLRARYPLLYLLTPEEERAMAELHALGTQLGKEVVAWSCTEGLGGDQALRDPLAALEAIRVSSARAIYVLRDLHPYFGNAAVVRKLRELGHAVKQSAKAVVLLSPVLSLPPELAQEVTLVDLAPPEGAMIHEMVGRAGQMAGRPAQLDQLDQERLVGAARGLTAGEIANGLARALVTYGGLDRRAIAVMAEEKRQVVRKTGVLEYLDHPEALDGVGGLGELKGWLRKRGRAFGRQAREFGLPEPRGLLLVGAPGCGKSLVAKSVARQWDLPLLRLDVGRLMSGLVGSSEENTRKALRVAEALSPVVLWVDELEKGFAGQGGDGGTAARVLATFLTWLQEKAAPVFVIATANDLARLPTELLRKGRFDEIFFVDLPDEAERSAILAIHLGKRRRHVPDYDLAALARACEGFSGAELEQVVIDALYDAFELGRPLADEDLHRAIAATVPLSRSGDGFTGLRSWAAQHARAASLQAPVAALGDWAIETPPPPPGQASDLASAPAPR